MSGINFYILDLETNGISKIHEITEIGIVRCSDRLMFFEQVKCDYPERSSLDSLAITGKTIKDLYNGINKKDLIDKVERYFNSDGLTPEHRCIIAHNAPFDRRFSHALWEKFDRPFPAALWLDTMSMMRKLYKDRGEVSKGNLRLETCCNYFGITKTAAFHNAKGDCKNTYYLWNKILESNFDYLPLIQRIPHLEKQEEIDMEDLLD